MLEAWLEEGKAPVVNRWWVWTGNAKILLD